MKLTAILSPDQVLADLQGRTKRAVMEELCENLSRQKPGLDPRELFEALQERERLGSTGIGDGVAIPHGRVVNLDTMLLAFGRSKAGVDFDSLDGRPAHIFFTVVVPENSAGVYIKILARISRLLKSNVVRRELMQAGDAQEIYHLIETQDEEF